MCMHVITTGQNHMAKSFHAIKNKIAVNQCQVQLVFLSLNTVVSYQTERESI